MLDFETTLAEVAERGQDLRALLTPKQAEIESDLTFKRVVWGSRQWGKTTWTAIAHALAAVPGATSLAIAPTVTKARDLLWPGMEWLNKECGAGMDLRRGDFQVITPNGGVIQLMGMSTEREAEKIRGYTPPFITIEECFVSATMVHPIGKITRHIARPAPTRLVSVDGVTSTPDHPYLTPEGWKRAEEIVPGDLLCLWEGFRSALSEATAADVFDGMPLRALFQNPEGERDAHEAAAAFCKSQSAASGRDAGTTDPLWAQVLRHTKKDWSQAESARRKRPWAHVAGVAARGRDKAEAVGCPDRHTWSGGPDALQVGPGRAIGEAGDRDRRRESRIVGEASKGPTQGCVAQWARVDRVEVHERGGVGRYEEVCPDGLVHDISTDSGFFFAEGRLVHNCGTFKPELLQFAIESCATPAQVKWFRRGGRGIALIGTPGRRIRDYWHQLCNGELGGSSHFATLADNPHIGDPDAYLEWVLADHKWTRAKPQFRREYLGQFCADTDSMCYLPGWNQVVLPQSAMPAEGYTIMGLDLGATKSPSAWVVFRITRELQGKEYKWITHAIHAEKHMTPTVHDVAAVTFRLRKQFGVARIRGDAAGQGAQTLDTLTTKFHGTPVEHAPKAGSKMARIWLMASMLQVDALRIYEGALPLADELLTVPWNEDRDDHHGSFPDHACDAGHYGIELVQQWVKEREPDAPAYGGPQWEKQQMERYKNEAIRRHLSEDN